jgi:hypothetical protein
MAKATSVIEHGGYCVDASTLMNSAEILSDGTNWRVVINHPNCPKAKVLSVSRRGKNPTILFEHIDSGKQFRLTATRRDALHAEQKLNKAMNKPFNREQMAAQDARVAAMRAARTLTPDQIEMKVQHQAKRDSEMDITFLKSCGIEASELFLVPEP